MRSLKGRIHYYDLIIENNLSKCDRFFEKGCNAIAFNLHLATSSKSTDYSSNNNNRDLSVIVIIPVSIKLIQETSCFVVNRFLFLFYDLLIKNNLSRRDRRLKSQCLMFIAVIRYQFHIYLQ